LKTTTRQEVVTHPWFDDDWGNEVIQQTIHREYITNEDDALLKHPDNFQGGYAIVNQEEKNKWGTVRGYAIHPGYSPIHGVSTFLAMSFKQMLTISADRCGLQAGPQKRQLGTLQSRCVSSQGNGTVVEQRMELQLARRAGGRLSQIFRWGEYHAGRFGRLGQRRDAPPRKITSCSP
jgi:hypothetical protein